MRLKTRQPFKSVQLHVLEFFGVTLYALYRKSKFITKKKKTRQHFASDSPVKYEDPANEKKLKANCCKIRAHTSSTSKALLQFIIQATLFYD